jgi:hypothetical protein
MPLYLRRDSLNPFFRSAPSTRHHRSARLARAPDAKVPTTRRRPGDHVWFIQDVNAGRFGPVTIDPNKQSITGTKDGKQVTVHYATDQSEFSIEKAMKTLPARHFNSKGLARRRGGRSSRASCRSCSCSFWIPLNQVQGGGSKVMNFGESREADDTRLAQDRLRTP